MDRLVLKRPLNHVPLRAANFSPQFVQRFFFFAEKVLQGLVVQGRQGMEMVAERSSSRNSSKMALERNKKELLDCVLLKGQKKMYCLALSACRKIEM